jgi:hypothetical protein
MTDITQLPLTPELREDAATYEPGWWVKRLEKYLTRSQRAELLAGETLTDAERAALDWPICPGCKQSMTGVYGGKPGCYRCTMRPTLT